MALSYKARKRWSLFILLVWMPVYVILAVTIVTRIWPDPQVRPPLPLELAIYVGLGLICFLPFRKVFLGVGQADPDATERRDD